MKRNLKYIVLHLIFAACFWGIVFYVFPLKKLTEQNKNTKETMKVVDKTKLIDGRDISGYKQLQLSISTREYRESNKDEAILIYRFLWLHWGWLDLLSMI
ncbi:MAG: hypothetical protein HY819_19635 [Acidobacteria bacterium]|nr:hypothetical protein [Acidobacteriota bacterium]